MLLKMKQIKPKFCSTLTVIYHCLCSEPIFVNLLRSQGIDSQPGRIDSWAPLTFTSMGSANNGGHCDMDCLNQKPNSWTYNFVEVSGHNFERSQTWCFRSQCLHYNQFQATFFLGGGGVVKSVCRSDCEWKGGKLWRLLSQLRPRIRPQAWKYRQTFHKRKGCTTLYILYKKSISRPRGRGCSTG